MSAVLPATTSAPTRPVLKPEVHATIDAAVDRLVAEFHPEQIWLFGSYAWGEPDEHSDLDFLVVVAESDASPLKRAQRAHHCLGGLSMAKDVLVKTRAEFAPFCDVLPSLTYRITHEGRLLYGSLCARASAADELQTRNAIHQRKEELVRQWLKKARSSLRIVDLIARRGDGPLDVAIVHCQEAAERALKGYLAFVDMRSQKTNDTEELVRQALAVDPAFAAIMPDASIVKPYAIKFRYPSAKDPMQPDCTEFDEALAAAQRIYDFVLSLLPAETHPT